MHVWGRTVKEKRVLQDEMGTVHDDGERRVGGGWGYTMMIARELATQGRQTHEAADSDVERENY